MDSLPEQQRELIQKMSDERLKQKLSKAGMPAAAISALTRPLLLEAWAELVASGRDKPVEAAAMVPMTDPELVRKRMEFEERKWADEMKLKQDEIKLKLSAQQAETEKLQLERERLRLQAEATESPAALALSLIHI